MRIVWTPLLREKMVCYMSFFFSASFALNVFLRAQTRAFWCPPLCQKLSSRSCFLMLSFVQNLCSLVWFLVRAIFPGRQGAPHFWPSPSCQESCFLVCSHPCRNWLSFMQKNVFFVALPRGTNRALDPTFLVLSLLPKTLLYIVIFGAHPFATNYGLDRARFCSYKAGVKR